MIQGRLLGASNHFSSVVTLLHSGAPELPSEASREIVMLGLTRDICRR
ncbi:hypothetical protein E2C01_032000 [Portunus trituberculatus]|uniref:Uncharacterized protein n=1 Tax=Portunus trituberculatus TaxID=210409 RepID=A0A5B7F067_PORTR|nr:hypothetical protein [Portunus trituberculatus]